MIHHRLKYSERLFGIQRVFFCATNTLFFIQTKVFKAKIPSEIPKGFLLLFIQNQSITFLILFFESHKAHRLLVGNRRILQHKLGNSLSMGNFRYLRLRYILRKL